MSQAIIQLSGVNKWFGDVHVLRDVDLAVKQGERMVICGPSGSGKSTLIRCINRLEHHDSGNIVVDGLTLDEDTEHVAAIRREVEKLSGPTDQDKADLCAGFQAAAADVLIDRSRRAMEIFIRRTGGKGAFVISGGVAANRYLRERLSVLCE